MKTKKQTEIIKFIEIIPSSNKISSFMNIPSVNVKNLMLIGFPKKVVQLELKYKDNDFKGTI